MSQKLTEIENRKNVKLKLYSFSILVGLINFNKLLFEYFNNKIIYYQLKII